MITTTSLALDPAFTTRYPMSPPPAAAQESMPVQASTGAVAQTSGRLRVCYFTAGRTGTYTQMVTAATAAAGATPTLCRGCCYAVDPATGNLTSILAAWANNTAAWAGTGVDTETLTAALNLVAGTVYASAQLVVTAAAAPNLIGDVGQSTAAALFLPPIAVGGVAGLRYALLDGQTDLPASVTLASMTASANGVYARFQ